MRKYILIIIGLSLTYFVGVYFINRDKLILKKATFSDVDEIDTLNYYPDRQLYIFGLVRNATFGRFSYSVGISKQDLTNPSNCLNYEIENSELEEFEVSKDNFIKTRESTERIDTLYLYNKENILKKIELLFNSHDRQDKLKFSLIK